MKTKASNLGRLILRVANKLTYQLILLPNPGEARDDASHAVVVDGTIVPQQSIAGSYSLLQSRRAKNSVERRKISGDR